MSDQPTAAWPYPLWIAHRGAGKLAPENTLAAFRLGAAHGYRAFECDVKLSADALPFLLHDATLERTTDGRGTAGLLSWADLSQRDAGAWHSRTFTGEPIPTLAAIAAFVLRNGFALNIEIKPTPGHDRHTGEVVAHQVHRLWSGQSVPPLLSSFSTQALEGAMAASPELPRALLVDDLWPGWFETTQVLGCVAVVTNFRLMDTQLIQRIHAADMRAMVYTVNDAADAQRLLALGIDGIITDSVDRFTPAAA